MADTLPELAVEDTGQGRPILLLHAFPLSSRMWDGQRQALWDIGRILTVDFPGFGRSPPPRTSASLSRVAAAILEELSKRRITSTAAVGLSMGGYLLFELVRQHPQLFDALVFADTRTDPDPPERRLQRELSALRSETTGVAHLLDQVPGMLSPRVSPRTKQRVQQMILSATPQGAAAASRAMAGRRDQRDVLKTIACPVLVVVGADDLITPVTDGSSMARDVPSARLRVISGAGHLSNLEAEESFNRAVFSFLA